MHELIRYVKRRRATRLGRSFRENKAWIIEMKDKEVDVISDMAWHCIGIGIQSSSFA